MPMEKKDFRILVVDDEEAFLLLLSSILEDEGYTVKTTSDPRQALSLSGSFRPDLVITDLNMPKMDGLRLIEEIRKEDRTADFIMITAYGKIETAVEAMKRGTADFLTKPLQNPEQLRRIVADVFRKRSGFLESRDLPPLDIVFLGIEQVEQDIRDVASTEATVMLFGETGTGKSLIARVIHFLSRRNGPFVDINCAAIPETLLESELFGYERGAFTGAVSQKKGKFEAADDGTIFLDEISEMSLSLQTKFLKVLQEKTFSRLGSLDMVRTNARVIAATNRDLTAMVKEGRFREDLYYRITVFPVTVPPLRSRTEHFRRLAEYLAGRISARLGREEKRIPAETLEKLRAYPWPGNIRELENVLERSIIVGRGPELAVTLPVFRQNTVTDTPPPGHDMKSVERDAIENALRKTNGNRRKAADLLGISLRSIQYKIKEYDIRS